MVGHLALAVESMNVADETGLQVCFMCGAPGSDSAGRLRLLASITA